MKAVAFQNRLCRDLDITSVNELPADIRQEILDAINGGLQKLHALAPPTSKEVIGSIPLPAPVTLSLEVTSGSTTIAGYDFEAAEYYRTIRIDGDPIDNQPMGTNELLHPYGGATGAVSATLYGDAVSIVEPYEELVSDTLRNLDTGDDLIHFRRDWISQSKPSGRPEYFHAEANAINRNSPAPAVLRFDHLPDRLYRLQGTFSTAPARIDFTDLLTPGADIPLRDELVEVYLLPISRSLLTSCRLWRDKDAKSKANADARDAEAKYEALTPKTLVTPRNRVRTKRGY